MVQRPDGTDTGEVNWLQNMRPLTGTEAIAFVAVGSLVLVFLFCLFGAMMQPDSTY